MKKRAVVVCPGRGTYNKETLGYLTRYHGGLNGPHAELIQQMDTYRRQQGQKPLSELDSASAFKITEHVTGDNASGLIFACAMADFLSIDRNEYEIVAVTGNSMGWYLALACAGAVSLMDGFAIVNRMGTTMHNEGPGGQVIYPLTDEQWRSDERLVTLMNMAIDDVEAQDIPVYDSIFLGGMRVLASSDEGVRKLLNALPKVQDRYPFSLVKHGAFHSPLMNKISSQALATMDTSVFHPPTIPLVDGRGHIWQNYTGEGSDNPNTSPDAMFQYTFGHQVIKPYDFSAAIDIAVKTFAPDKLIILGPGSTLGAPVAQQLIDMCWKGLSSKDSFKRQQADNPAVLSMGIDEQRAMVTA